MNHMDILAKFLQLFPTYQDKVSRHTSDGDDGIEIILTDDQRLVFIYHTDYDWLLLNNTRRV